MKRSLLLMSLLTCAAMAEQAKTPDAGTPSNADTPAAEAPAADKADAPKPEAKEGEEAPAPTENTADKVDNASADNVQDATLRIREQLKLIDTKLGELSKPSRSLVSSCNSTKSRVNGNLPAMDKLAKEVAELQEEFRRAGAADYAFTHVTVEHREDYAKDGAAAYKAMEADMKEKKSKRKVGGLDKFELMRDRYQGVPEYKQAHAKYLKTLKDLSKKWRKMLDTEQARRKGLPPAKKEALNQTDQEELNKLEEFFSKNGEDIATVWYNPSPRNMAMLRNCVNKVEDALRRNKDNRDIEKECGTVPTLLTQYWQVMDEARRSLINGDLEGAERMLKDDGNFKVLVRLKPSLLPAEYKEPLTKEHGDMLQEIQKRERAYRTTKTSLERKSGTLERMISSAQAQIDNTLDKIEHEIGLDVGAKTAEVEEPADSEDEAEAREDAEKQPAAEEPAKTE